MSETAPESSGGASKNFLTKKVGPLPMWAWMAIVLVLGVVYSMYKKQKAATTATTSGTAAGGVNSPGGVDSSLVPQFVNQVYNQEQPPAAPNITVNKTLPTPPTVAPQPPVPNVPPKSPPPEPATVSGSPGSYTTGLGGKYPDEWTSTGVYSLNTIAKSHGMTAQQLIAASEASQNNVALKSYASKGNFNAKLPAGVQLFFPSANWAVRK